MGWLRCQHDGKGEVFSFEYDPEWLALSEKFAFDPELALVGGAQYPAVDRTNFGIFLDSAPDRWGRVLSTFRLHVFCDSAPLPARHSWPNASTVLPRTAQSCSGGSCSTS